jgi:hypothetical protein
MPDIATAITDSLDREGRGGMNAALKFADGAAATPGITWLNEPSTGWYRAAAGDMRATILGSDLFRLQGGQAQVFAGAQWNNLLYSVPAGNVPSGTAAWQTLTWDNGNSVWRATGKFLVDNNTGAITVPAGGSVTAPTFIGALTGNASTATSASTATTATNCTRTVTGATGVTGGGPLTANQVLSLDTGSPLNVDHSTLLVGAGQGLTGGGALTGAGVTVNVAVSGLGITLNTDSIALNYTHLNTVYLGVNGTAVQSNTVTDQNSPNPRKIFVGPHPGAGADANTIYFVV